MTRHEARFPRHESPRPRYGELPPLHLGRKVLAVWAGVTVAIVIANGVVGDDSPESTPTTTAPPPEAAPITPETRVMDDGTRLPSVRAELEERDVQGAGEAVIRAIDYWTGTRDPQAFEEFEPINLEDHVLPTMRGYFGEYGTRELTPGEGDHAPEWGYSEWAGGQLDGGTTTFLALRDGLYLTDDGRMLTHFEMELRETPQGLQLGAFNVTAE